MKRILPLLLLTAIGFCGCAHRPQPAEDQPLLSLKLAVNDIYCTQTACSCVHDVAARTYEETQQQLLKQFGVDLTLVYYEEPYELEKAILVQVLERCDGNRTLAADKLGISRRTIQRKIQDFELPF